jgi:SAM-dependent methyltransferase
VSFPAAWLDLREPADRAARDPGLLAQARAWLGDGLAVDLGCGTGSTLRAFGPGPGRWRLVDNDPALLACATQRHPAAETARADLADIAAAPLDGARLVTASALLDLVSADWLDALADRVAASGAGLYAALSYDGRMDWTPALAGDAAVRAAFNAHQRGDKGFGPALGPAAGPALREAMARRGYNVALADSPWVLGPDTRALRDELEDGIAAAAAEAGCAEAAGWAQARRAARGAGACVVGHVDVLALPAGASAQSNTTSEPSP